MAPRETKVAINDAPSQLGRWLRALEAGHAPVDGRTREELLDFAPRFGALIYFYDLKNTRDGDWSEFFLADPVMVLASIDALDASAVEDRFLVTVREVDAARNFERSFSTLSDAFQLILGLARRFDLWLRGAGLGAQGELSRLLGQGLVSAVEGPLSGALRALVSAAKGAGLPQALGRAVRLDTEGMLPLWGLEELAADGASYKGASKEARARAAAAKLEPLLDPFLDALSRLQGLTGTLMPAALATGNHPPNLALYLSFVQLFRTAQDTVNTVSGRYAGFYHRDVLRLRHRAALPDSTYLTFTLAEDEEVREALVPRGTLFPAGKRPDGQDILFASDTSVGVTPATVARRLALRVLRGPLLPLASPLADEEDALTVVRQVLTSEMPLEPARTDAESSDDERLPGWATFGAVRAGVTPTTVTASATLGFALASRYLLLTGGTRVVTLEVPLAPASAKRLGTLLTALASATGLDTQSVLRQVLREAFTLQVSTAEGWLTVERYEPVLPPPVGDAEPRGFGLWFELTPSAPSVVPNGTAPAPDLPMLRAFLKPEPVTLKGGVEVHPVSLLDAVDFSTLELRVRVSDLSGVSVENTQGGVDPSVPWPLFGSEPVVGSYVRIRHTELFVKRPETLRLSLDWFNLPSNKDGFHGYYRDYVVGPDGKPTADLFDNQSFLADLRVLQPGSWMLQPLMSPLSPVTLPEEVESWDTVRGYLFRTKDDCANSTPSAKGELCKDTMLEQFDISPSTPPDYYDPAASALELRLAAPSYAFGDSLYTVNVLSAVLAELPDPLVQSPPPPPKDLKYPNPPWLPQLQKLSIHYSAHCTLDDVRFFHLLPFEGFKQVAPEARRPLSLLPRFKAPANLYLGFTGLETAQTLTLLFQLSGTFMGEGAPPVVRWDLLTAAGWSSLAPSQVLFDSTGGLQGTGILALSLPAFSSQGSTLIPSGAESELQWMRASVADDAEAFPRTLQVTPHALLATRQEPGVDVETPVPAGSITLSVQELPDIGGISQPMPSFGGRPPETPRTFEARASERLRHKERAVLAWDYERLVLERFPSIWKVKALPAHTPLQAGVPGAVLVVVVPGRDGTTSADATVPQVTSDMLERIQRYLEERASPFARIRVVNPIYVHVTVKALVDFRVGEDVGASIDRLDRELVEYLSPWYHDASRATRQGQYASEADISDFIQTRPYVQALLSLELGHTPPPEALESDWYFLTSATRHELQAAGAPVAEPLADGY
ncbi:baseplate J/gp47 family protein [Corallococcus terminator]